MLFSIPCMLFPQCGVKMMPPMRLLANYVYSELLPVFTLPRRCFPWGSHAKPAVLTDGWGPWLSSSSNWQRHTKHLRCAAIIRLSELLCPRKHLNVPIESKSCSNAVNCSVNDQVRAHQSSDASRNGTLPLSTSLMLSRWTRANVCALEINWREKFLWASCMNWHVFEGRQMKKYDHLLVDRIEKISTFFSSHDRVFAGFENILLHPRHLKYQSLIVLMLLSNLQSYTLGVIKLTESCHRFGELTCFIEPIWWLPFSY